ncbi:MAG: hypothetical protein ABFD13_06630 [Candidatus Cryosericum sp.]|nr:hypothetical protein [bacterium]
MTRPGTVVTRIVVAVPLCAALLVAVLFLFSGKRPTNILTSTAFVPKQSLPVGSVAVIEKQARDINGNSIVLEGRKILIFSNKACGSCTYLTFPLIEWVREFRDVSFCYIEKSDQIPLIYAELKSDPNFHIIADRTSHLYKTFGEPSTPSVFFIDDNNRVMWKNTGFLITDYKRYGERIRDFSLGKTIFDDYQDNIEIGKPFPKITYSDKGTAMNLPTDYLGKPTLMLFVYSSSKASKDLVETLSTSALANDAAVNKVIVFAGITEDTVQRNLDFAERFSLKQLEYEAKEAELSRQIDLLYVLQETKDFKSTAVIEDDFFEISNRIALVGGPFMCMLDAEGQVLNINAVKFDTPDKCADLFRECKKVLEERR